MSERRFLTWCLEDGETEEDFKITFAHDEEDAAVRRAQHDFHRGDPFNSTAIAVRREGGNGPHGPVIVFDVEVRAEPGFYAHARAPGEPSLCRHGNVSGECDIQRLADEYREARMAAPRSTRRTNNGGGK